MPNRWRERQQGIADLNTLAANDIRRLLSGLTTRADVEQALNDILPRLIQTYGLAAAALAADWYDDYRDELGIKGRFTAIPTENTKTGSAELVAWATDKAVDDAGFQTLVLGGVQRRIANFDRYTIVESSLEDPGSRGWERVGDGDSCPFCDMLIGRGVVYSEASVDFASHDHCGCTAVPAFDGEPKPVREYTPSARNISDADRERAQRWINENL